MRKSMENQTGKNVESLSFLQVLASSVMAALGVQSNRIRERDFTRGNILQFFAAGLLLTIIFLVSLIAIVNLVV